MRVNMDSSVATDVRFRLLAKDLDISHREVIGGCFLLWLCCYEQRRADLSPEEVDLASGFDGFSEALVARELAHIDVDNRAVIHGVSDRIAFLKAQAEKGKKGGKKSSRKKPGNGVSKGLSPGLSKPNPSAQAKQQARSGSAVFSSAEGVQGAARSGAKEGTNGSGSSPAGTRNGDLGGAAKCSAEQGNSQISKGLSPGSSKPTSIGISLAQAYTPTLTPDLSINPPPTEGGAGGTASAAHSARKNQNQKVAEVRAHTTDFLEAFNRYFGRSFQPAAWEAQVRKALAKHTPAELRGAAWGAKAEHEDSPEVIARFKPSTILRLTSRENKTTLPQWLEIAEHQWAAGPNRGDPPWRR